MSFLPSRDLDGLNDRQIIDLAEQVRDSWKERNEAIADAVELRKQKWQVVVPPAWRQTARVFHSALSKEIPARVTGTIASQRMSFSRMSPDDDESVEDRAVRVSRWTMGHHQWQARHAVPGKNAWTFALDQLINKGAVCVGSTFSPHAWSSVPARFMEGNDISAVNWRDDKGQPTSDPERVDLSASARHYQKQVDEYRKRARPPVTRRVPQTEQCYPLIVEGELLALIIIRDATILEVDASGFGIELLGGNGSQLGSWALSSSSNIIGGGGSAGGLGKHELIEVITPNKMRYYYHKHPLLHPQWGKELVTNYDFVPYVYQVGLEGGELEYGDYGTPLLNLIDSNIRMIDTMLTYQLNAIHLASFTSYYIEYDPQGQWNLVEGDTGRQLTTFDFKTGTVMDLGPYKKPVPLTHPGLNKDFDSFLKFQIEEVNRIIPRTLQGVAESSGYNTAQSTVQAKAIFWPIADGAEAVAERLAYFDLQHIAKRVPGPVYLNLEQLSPSGKPKKVSRIGITADDIEDYYDMSCTIDRELDRVTLGQFALNMMKGGVGDDEWVWEMAGGEDYQQMRSRRARMQLLQSETMMAALEERAVKRFGMQAAMDEAKAAGRIEQGDDGTPMVKMPNGKLIGPGKTQTLQQTPQGQAAAGATFGGANTAALQGGPNMSSTNNPGIAQPPAPGPTAPTRGRNRRRGGPTPGLPQRQPVRPTPQAGIV